MNFIQNIAQMGTNVQSALSIAVSDKGEITGCIYPQAKDIKDKAVQRLRPLNFGGTPEQLDEHFFSEIQTPTAQTIALIRNLCDVQDGLKTAEKPTMLLISANAIHRERSAYRRAFSFSVSSGKVDSVQVFPFYYQDDPNEIIQKAAFLSDGTLTVTDEMQQRGICAFMERRVIDLRTDGYV